MKLQRTELKKARIEIIPMIDTIFFLLVFFMITSISQVQMSAKKVALPVSTTAESKPRTKVVLTVDDKGNYYVDRGEVKYSDILPALQERVAENPDTVIVINCDKTQQVEQFQYALDIAQRANPASLMIATTPKTAQN
ncbi:MAG: ExbD/TolR family protein [Janthinobacterium lividum]